ncbi:2TM domain-containing protein [Bacillus sp. 31A1R]|uniref:2TM domain-containing protein n=1 Tax=Robertmurraya mangrovi TaxID=3098077 RepID=A0ABU5J0K2_9BACI|nr:2TM domain-containing protein [Bacillus sp. 31A1R]MDZ5472929.1 2TM domain-containing protein [Bacillus sp. 31A1R]
MEKDEKYLKAKRRVQNLKAFYLHLTVFILVNSMLIFINFNSDYGNWWFLYPLGGWGIGLLVHAITTLAYGRFGSDWEEKKIKEYMDQDR